MIKFIEAHMRQRVYSALFDESYAFVACLRKYMVTKQYIIVAKSEWLNDGGKTKGRDMHIRKLVQCGAIITRPIS